MAPKTQLVKRRRLCSQGDAWRPSLLDELEVGREPIEITPETERPVRTLPYKINQFRDEVERSIALRPDIDRADQKKSLQIQLATLAAKSPVTFDARSDILAAFVIGLLTKPYLRAHSSGIYHFRHGSWLKIETLPCDRLLELDSRLTDAIKILRHMDQFNLERKPDVVLDFGAGYDPNKAEDSVGSSTNASQDGTTTRRTRTWQSIGYNVFKELAVRFASCSKFQAILQSFGNWCVEDPPEQTDALDFEEFHINGLYLCVLLCFFVARTVRSSHAQLEFYDRNQKTLQTIVISEYPYR